MISPEQNENGKWIQWNNQTLDISVFPGESSCSEETPENRKYCEFFCSVSFGTFRLHLHRRLQHHRLKVCARNQLCKKLTWPFHPFCSFSSLYKLQIPLLVSLQRRKLHSSPLDYITQSPLLQQLYTSSKIHQTFFAFRFLKKQSTSFSFVNFPNTITS